MTFENKFGGFMGKIKKYRKNWKIAPPTSFFLNRQNTPNSDWNHHRNIKYDEKCNFEPIPGYFKPDLGIFGNLGS